MPNVQYIIIIKGFDMKQKSICDEFPKLMKEWHLLKNKQLKPQNISCGSNKKVWWICNKGHEWQASVFHRTKAGSNCPYCSGRYAIPGENDLQTLMPAIAKEWHTQKNNELFPIEVKAGSNRKVWWICEEGHEWQATISDRTRKNGSGCPYCSGNLNIKGTTDLQTLYPYIAEEWHHVKNEGFTAYDFSKYSGKKVWWICKKGHEWQASIISRTKSNASCPYCAGKKPIKGETDLATCAPDLEKQWNYIKNGFLKPSDVTFSSGRKVWWKCNKGHEWQAVISTRTGNNKCGCPYCSGRYAIPGVNDLATIKPKLAKEWHPEKNKILCSEVTIASNKKVWWMCDKGHEWRAMISVRSAGRGCPYCSGYLAISGVTDLATLNPELALEWHPTKNKMYDITKMTAHSSKKVWWMCNKGHEWRSTIIMRSYGAGCPYCFKEKN